MTDAKITMYGTRWCIDCIRAKDFLGRHDVPYTWVDIDRDQGAADHVRGLNDGKRIVPTIVFEDGSILVEPTNAELASKLDIRRKVS